jgi:outer membrane protein assembly factor BamB
MEEWREACGGPVRQAEPGRLAILTWALAAALALAAPAAVHAQFFFGPAQAARAAKTGPDADTPAEPVENTFAPADRATLQQLRRARNAIDQGRYGEALEGLAEVLRANDDYFFQPDRKQPVYRSLKAEARRLIGEMPREGRDLYEIRAGADARAMLQRSLAAGDSAELAKVSVRYFHTQAGYEATFLLGLWQLDHASPLAAMLTFKRLLDVPEVGQRFEPALSLAAASAAVQAHLPEEAGRLLAALRERRPEAMPSIGGQPVRWFAGDAEIAAWLGRMAGSGDGLHPPPAGQQAPAGSEPWTMSRGDPARNAASAGGAPLLSLRWRVPVSDDDAQAETALLRLQHSFRRRGALLLPSIQPLVVDDLVLMRTVRKLLAVNFSTGKREWDVPVDDPLDTMDARNQVQIDPFNQQQSVSMRWALLGQRIWEDAAYGTLASDGRLVFSLEDLGTGARSFANMGVVFGPMGNRAEAHGPSNRLAATDIRTGKLKWELGGAAGSPGLPQKETFFLGPPLPLRGQLYVLAEAHDEIRLIALEAASGQVLWSQQLTMVEQGIGHDLLRRLAGVSPSYGNGILVCPTGANSVVAVDLATHALLWGYRFPPVAGAGQAASARQQMLFNLRNGWYTPGMLLVPRWLEATATVVDGRVLLTPPEGDALFCVNLADGQPAWPPVPREEDLYLACVHRGTVVLAGKDGVRAIRLADGKPAWDGRKISLSPGTTVSGRGFYCGNRYFLPSSGAEVLVIDLDRGTTVQTVKSRRGSIPGNLVCYRGRILSQGLDGLEEFYQADVAREEIRARLAANPHDVEMLALSGEVLLEEGKRAEAVAQFRRACEADGDGGLGTQAHELLRDALLGGLRDEFTVYRQRAAEIEPLLEEAGQRAQYLRLLVAGFQRQGEWKAAVAQCLKLADLDPAGWPVEQVERPLRVRRDRWLAARLAALRREGGPAAASEIDRALEPRLREALSAEGLASPRRFVQCFGEQPAGAEARRQLIERLVKADGLLEAEMLVLGEHAQAEPAAAAAGLVELAGLFRRAGRLQAEAACCRALAQRYGDVVCPGGKTGRQWVADLPGDAAVRRELRPAAAWPVGDVEAKPAAAADPRGLVFGRFGVSLDSDPGPFFADIGLRFDQNRHVLTGVNGLGQTCFDEPLMEGGQRAQFFYNPNYLAKAEGHLLLLPTAARIFAVDPLGISGGAHKALWSEDLTDGGDAADANPWGPFGFQQFAFRMDPLGPVTGRYVAFVRFSSLVVVDPVTGQVLWVREDLPAGCEVFGDEQYIFVLPPAGPAMPVDPFGSPPAAGEAPRQREALVLAAMDGELLGHRAVPLPKNGNPYGTFFRADRNVRNVLQDSGLATIGRFVLLWEGDTAGAELSLADPWQQPAAAARRWGRKFSPAAQVCMVGQEAVAVLERDGRLTLMGLPDGRTIGETVLPLRRGPNPAAGNQPGMPSNPAGLSVFHWGDQYFVLVHEWPSSAARGLFRAVVQPLLGAICVLNVMDACVADMPRLWTPQSFSNQPLSPLPGALYQAVQQGRLFALDERGKPQWPAGVPLQGQHLLLSQPTRLPVIVLANLRHPQRPNGRRFPTLWVQVVDRRTGRIVYDRVTENPSGMGILELAGNAEQKTVELRMPAGGRPANGSVVLRFTDKPPTARPPAKKPEGRITDALRRAVEQAIGVGDQAAED